MTIKEIFSDHKGKTRYYVSDTGLVLSTYIIEGAETITIDGVLYSVRNHSVGVDGYPTVTIRHKKLPIHRLVATHFIAPDDNPDRKLVNHIDGNKLNNKVSNLEWVTHAENAAHAIRLGLRKTNSQDFITRTVCSECERPMYYRWCKTVEDDEKRTIYKIHGEPKIVKITRRLDYK